MDIDVKESKDRRVYRELNLEMAFDHDCSTATTYIHKLISQMKNINLKTRITKSNKISPFILLYMKISLPFRTFLTTNKTSLKDFTVFL